MDFRIACTVAVRNVANFGDTDVLPFPFENMIFHDRESEVVDLLMKYDANFQDYLKERRPEVEHGMAAVGYSGFRWATQIDPIWNAYLLANVIAIGSNIETARLSVSSKRVFSYRFDPVEEDGSIFSRNVGWNDFQEQARHLAQKFAFVLQTDISNFYPRTYHHRVENSLDDVAPGSHRVKIIIALLSTIAGTVSYGLPVGGPAARLLSESLLNRTDRLLDAAGVTFCRFADDYYVFAQNQEDAYANLIFLNDTLLTNEGLSLQKSKTRIMTSAEFLSHTSPDARIGAEAPEERESRRFLALRVHFDPYSPTAEEDYERLAKALSEFDLVGMLNRELAKSQIQTTIMKKLLQAIKVMNHDQKELAVISLLENLPALYPLFPQVMILLRTLHEHLSNDLRAKLFEGLRGLFSRNSYILKVDTNLAFAVQVLALENSEEATRILTSVYNNTDKEFIKRIIILGMMKNQSKFFLSNCIKRESSKPGLRRVLIVSSYALNDEGKHWRTHMKKSWDEFEQMVALWAAERKNGGVEFSI